MADAPQTARNRIRWVLLAVVGIIAVVAVVIYLSAGRESTDDAQIEGRITQITARVGGPIVAVDVADNQFVEAGTELARIDPREYQIAVDRARAELADAQATAGAAGYSVPIAAVSTVSDVKTASGSVEEAEAGIAVADRQVDAAKAEIAAAEARRRERQATATKLAKDVERLRPLVAKDEVAQQQFDAAVAAADSARASAEAADSDVAVATTGLAVAQQRAVQARAAAGRAQAGLQGARTAPEQLKMTQARATAAEARVKQAEAMLAQAELNLERATIKAPTAGIVSRKSIEVGQTVQSGQPLMALVARDDLWVVANFKETQMAKMRPGQKATVKVDALGGRTFHAHLDSLGAATGAKFSLLPPENATGNYVKVVQRVPVKIVFEPGQDPERLLRPGLSVTPTVQTK